MRILMSIFRVKGEINLSLWAGTGCHKWISAAAIGNNCRSIEAEEN
jgi:hypothetical protein